MQGITLHKNDTAKGCSKEREIMLLTIANGSHDWVRLPKRMRHAVKGAVKYRQQEISVSDYRK